MLGEKLLRFLPIADNLSNSVTDEKRGPRRMGWGNKGTIQRVRPCLNFMADDVHTFDGLYATETSKQLVAQEKDASDEYNRESEDTILHELYSLGSGQHCHRGRQCPDPSQVHLPSSQYRDRVNMQELVRLGLPECG